MIICTIGRSVVLSRQLIIFLDTSNDERMEQKMDKATISCLAADKKATSMTFRTPEVTPANHAAIMGAIDVLREEIESVSASGSFKTTFSATFGALNPLTGAGLRGEKMAIRWYSAAANGGEGQFGSNEIGAADKSIFTEDPDGIYRLHGGNYDAIKAAFDSLVRTDDDNNVSVYEIVYVNRTL